MNPHFFYQDEQGDGRYIDLSKIIEMWNTGEGWTCFLDGAYTASPFTDICGRLVFDALKEYRHGT